MKSGVRLSWSYPVKTIKGTDIVDISSFDLYRAVIPLSDYLHELSDSLWRTDRNSRRSDL